MLSKLQLTLLAMSVCAALLAHTADAAAVADADAATNDGDGVRNKRQAPVPAFDQVLRVVCQGLQAIVPACSLVGSAPANSVPVSGVPVGRQSRRKRSFFNSFSNFPSFPNFHHSGWSDPWGQENVTCPEQQDQAAVYMLSDNPANYPANQITLALVQDAALFNCLVGTLVFDNTPPALVPDAVIAMSNATCPFVQRRLFSYFSVNAQTNCFVLQNFQENVIYTECLNSSAVKCQQETSDSWHVRSGPSWGHPTTNVTRNFNRCLKDFQRVSVWSYCPSLPVGLQIIRDRIIVPAACLAFSVPCTVTKSGHWPSHWW